MSKRSESEREAHLYTPVQNYLDLEFYHQIKPKLGILRFITAITATTAVRDVGSWSRPDLSGVAVWRNKYSSTAHVDIYTFEVKRETTVDTSAVHEALAHRRFSNYSYLVWDCRPEITSERHAKLIAEMCRDLGVGLIFAHEHDSPTSYRIEFRATRAEVAPDDVDRFIETRLPDAERRDIISALHDISKHSAL